MTAVDVAVTISMIPVAAIADEAAATIEGVTGVADTLAVATTAEVVEEEAAEATIDMTGAHRITMTETIYRPCRQDLQGTTTAGLLVAVATTTTAIVTTLTVPRRHLVMIIRPVTADTTVDRRRRHDTMTAALRRPDIVAGLR
jgi:hypothetical protein